MALIKLLYLIFVISQGISPIDCNCLNISDEYFDCPEVMKIGIRDDDLIPYLAIDCLSVENSIYQSIPERNFVNISTVKFRQCPLPMNGTSIQMILRRLGITKISKLYLDIVQNTLNDSLERQHLPDDLFNDLQNLTLLDLNNSHVHLSLNIFKPLKKMEILNLGDISLEFLEPGIFKYQKNIKQILLFDNELKNLTKESFSGAESLEVLNLAACNIKTFVADIFSNLINLKEINLNLNNFTFLPDELFDNNKQLDHIELVDNCGNMTTLPSRMLANLRALKEVYIINARLDTIHGDLFVGSTQIEIIILQRNKFKTLPANIFHDLINLHMLDLSNNELIQLDDMLFNNTVSLKELYLSYNNLTVLSSIGFENLVYLKNLYLDNNKLHTIDLKSFYRLQSLFDFELSNNKLTFKSLFDFWDSIDSKFGNVIRLLHSHTSQNNTDYEIIQLKFSNASIEIFKKRNSSTSYIGSTVVHFEERKLKNHLSEITDVDDFKKRLSLTVETFDINLNYKPINCSCWIYNFLTYIKKIKNIKPFSLESDKLYCNETENVINRQIETIEPKEFLCLLDLYTDQILCPSGCICRMLPYYNKLILNCSNANLNSVPQVPILDKIESVEFLLDNNNLIALPTIYNNTNSGYKLVTKLYLANNKLRNIEPENIPNNLRLLNLTNNQLTQMSLSVLNKLKNNLSNLENLYLSGNPWTCDCTTITFLIYCLDISSKISDASMIECENDGNYLNLNDKGVGYFCSQSNTFIISLTLSIVSIGFLIGIMTAIYYKYQIEIKIWLFDKKIFTRWVNEYDVDVNMIYDAFVAYSHLDVDFITKYIIPELEFGSPKYKLCLHERDWKIGNTITQSIADSVAYSRRTIIILSSNFVNSDWAKFEFRVAYDKSMAEKRSRLIVIVYGEQEIDKDKLDNELKAYLNTNTYIKWGDKWFWKRLRYALPHPNSHRLQSPTNQLDGLTDDE